MLRPPTLRAQLGEIADTASREQMSYRAFLAELLLSECDDRARRRSARRIRAAGFAGDKSLRSFDLEANPNIDAAGDPYLGSLRLDPQKLAALPDR